MSLSLTGWVTNLLHVRLAWCQHSLVYPDLWINEKHVALKPSTLIDHITGLLLWSWGYLWHDCIETVRFAPLRSSKSGFWFCSQDCGSLERGRAFYLRLVEIQTLISAGGETSGNYRKAIALKVGTSQICSPLPFRCYGTWFSVWFFSPHLWSRRANWKAFRF